jgi:hypothetical protein
MQLPISLERPATRPVTPISDNAEGFRNDREQQTSRYVYRGELLQSANDRAYRPQANLQISPENRRAISAYHKIADEPPVLGKILDGYI